MLDKNHFKDLITITLIVALFALAALILKPIIIAIIYGVLLAYIFFPIYKFIVKRIKNKTLSALLICLTLLALIIAATALIMDVLLKQAVNLYLVLQTVDLTTAFDSMMPSILASSELSSTIMSSLNNAVSQWIGGYISGFGDFILYLPLLVLQLFVVIFVFFFALRDGEEAIEYINTLSPLKKENQERFSKQFKDITNSVLVGQIVIGIIQGLAAGIGYYLFGVPNVLLFTLITMLFSIIPIVGPWIIWIPIDIYLFSKGNSGAGIGLLIYGAIIINWIDNFIRPFIVSRRAKLNTAIILIGMIGGMLVFGILGLIIGPLVLAYVLLVFELYRKKTAEDSIIFKKEE